MQEVIDMPAVAFNRSCPGPGKTCDEALGSDTRHWHCLLQLRLILLGSFRVEEVNLKAVVLSVDVVRYNQV